MVLENVKEMWTEKPKGGKGKGVNKDRFVSKMYAFPVRSMPYCFRRCTAANLTLCLQVPSWRLGYSCLA